MPLLVVGPYRAEDAYHRQVQASASSEVLFPGSIYETSRLSALRFHAALYLHGHTVGGTNPSLVESMAAGNAVAAHDNPYNRWVAGTGNSYFSSTDDLAELLDALLPDEGRRQEMGRFSRARFQQEFTWAQIGDQYERALLASLNQGSPRSVEASKAGSSA